MSDRYKDISDDQLLFAAYFAVRKVEELMRDLCAAAAPHPVHVYPTYNHFNKVLHNLNEALTEQPSLDKRGKALVVIEILGSALDGYMNIWESFGMHFDKTAEFAQIQWIHEAYHKLLDGMSPKELTEYYKNLT